MKDTEIMLKAIKSGAEKYADAQIQLLKSFAGIDCESCNEEGNTRVIELLEPVFKELGIEPEYEYFPGVGRHLIARIKPENTSGKVILNAHLDTVFPAGFTAAHPCRVEGDYLYGLGVGDCKAGVVISLMSVKILMENGLLPDKEITIIYNCDEEIGSGTGQRVFEREARGAQCAFVFEGARVDGDGVHGIVTSRPGVILGSMDIKGVEAHAGADYLSGHSAIRELAHKITKYYSFNDYERKIYYNVAPISGGRPNGVVASDAHAEFCVAGLPTNAAFEEASENIKSLERDNEDPVCTVTTSQRVLFPAMEKSEKNSELYRHCETAASLLGIRTREISDPCATDACYLSTYGVATVDALGSIERNIHTVDESLYIPSLKQATELFCVILATLKDGER